MPTERTGTGRSTTFFDDPPEITLSGAGTNHYFDSPDGIGAAVAPANHGRIRYNNTTKTWQVSMDGGAYSSISLGGSVSGSGTAGTIPKWFDSVTLTDSIMVETPTLITISGSLAASVVRTGGFTGGSAFIAMGMANDREIESKTTGGTVVSVIGMYGDDKVHIADSNVLECIIMAPIVTLGLNASSVIQTTAVFRPRGTTGSPSAFASIFLSNDATIESKTSGGVVTVIAGLYADNKLHLGDPSIPATPVLVDSNDVVIGFGSSSNVQINGDALGLYGTSPVAQGAPVADVAGGVVIDAECRTAVNAILARLRAPGFIAT